MCKNSRILSRTNNGEFSICKGCKTYSLFFNNVLLQFNKKQLIQFKEYISNINVEYWLDYYSLTTLSRKIPISTKQHNLYLFFSEEEFDELKSLITIKEKTNSILSACDINYPLILN